MHQFENAVDHRMTEEEAQAVLQVLSERQRLREGRPSLQDIASLANAPLADVQSALAEVRANFVPVEQPRQKERNSMLPVLAFCSAVAILLFFVLGMFMFMRAEAVPPPQVTAPAPFPSTEVRETAKTPDAAPSTSSEAPPAGQ